MNRSLYSDLKSRKAYVQAYGAKTNRQLVLGGDFDIPHHHKPRLCFKSSDPWGCNPIRPQPFKRPSVLSARHLSNLLRLIPSKKPFTGIIVALIPLVSWAPPWRYSSAGLTETVNTTRCRLASVTNDPLKMLDPAVNAGKVRRQMFYNANRYGPPIAISRERQHANGSLWGEKLMDGVRVAVLGRSTLPCRPTQILNI
jgi:hypothetical protein